MARRKPRRQPLDTIWEVSDELWQRIEPIFSAFWCQRALKTSQRGALENQPF
jgi:acyl carrier protein phosphodiesterase